MQELSAVFRGLLQTQLGLPTTGQQEVSGLETEWCRRLILNGTYIDANGTIHFGLADFDFGSGTVNGELNVTGNAVFSGVMGTFTNSTVNTLSVIADTAEMSAIVNFYQGAVFANSTLQFSDGLNPPDVRIQRVFTGELALIAAAGGLLSFNTDGDSFGHLGFLNDAGGIFFGNGSASFLTDTSLSRISQGVLGVGQAGYGGANGEIRAHIVSFANSTSALQASLVQAGSNSITFQAGAGAFAVAQNGDTNPRIGLLNDNGGVAFGNGSVSADGFLSRVAPGTLGIGSGGYGGSNGIIQVNEVAFCNTSSGVRVTLTQLGGSNTITFTAGTGGGVAAGVNGDADARLHFFNDGGGILFGNGSVAADTSISRVANGIVGIGFNGYGDATGQLNANTVQTTHLILGDANATANMGGVALTAGQANAATVTIAGAVNGDVVEVTPDVHPGVGSFMWHGVVTDVGVITVYLVCLIGGTPTSSKYNVRLIR